MWLSDGWHMDQYALLDCGDGERLEAWSGVRLIRPDPQVIWSKRAPQMWNDWDASFERTREGGGSWIYREGGGEEIKKVLRYGNIRMRVTPTSFKQTGVFPEQAANWDWISERLMMAPLRLKPVRVLNLFAYTGGATLASLIVGSTLTHCDAARGMVTWARENAQLSGLADARVRWIVEDCMKFCTRELRRGAKYDAIIMDPPSFGRGPSGEIWKNEDHLWDLLRLAICLLSETPVLMLLSLYTGGLSPGVGAYMMKALIHERFGSGAAAVVSQELGLPISGTDLALPCGSSTRVTFKYNKD